MVEFIFSALRLRFHHRHFHLMLPNCFYGFVIFCIRMASNAQGGVVVEHTIQPDGHFSGTVSHDDLPGMKRVSNANAASIVDRDTTGSRDGVSKGVENWPIG